MADLPLRLLLVFIGLFIGFGFGFLFACWGASGIVKEKNELKEELEKVKSERDELKTKSVRVVEIHDPTVGKNVKFGGF